MEKTEIKVSCIDQVLKITESPILASGGLSEVRVVFSFCEKWNGFEKTAIFYRDDEPVYYSILDENDTCVVPWEVCYEEGTFKFGVFGDKGVTRRTSLEVKYKVKKGAITADTMPSDPTPAVYDQIMSLLGEMRESQAGFISVAEKAVVDAETATQEAQTATANANTATASANKATQDANSAASNANAEAGKATKATEDANTATANANKATDDARAATEETNTARENIVREAGEILASLSDAVYAAPIECTANGDVIAVNDASDNQLAGLTLYGKTTQNVTPTPDAPIPLESVGESIGVTVAGKNLVQPSESKVQNGITKTVNADGSFTLKGTATADTWLKTEFYAMAGVAYILSGCPGSGSSNTYMQYYSEGGQFYYDFGNGVTIKPLTGGLKTIYIQIKKGVTMDATFYQMVRLADTDAAFDAPKAIQTITASTPTKGGDTLTWDGNTEGLDCVEGMYRLSDAIVTAEDIANGLEVTLFDGYDAITAETSIFASTTSLIALGVNYNGMQFGMLVISFNAEEGLPVGVYYIEEVDGVWMCSLTIPGYTGFSTATPLCGIPVTSGGNYTDENGQQWICDEIDFARGVYAKRVEKVQFDGTEPWYTGGMANAFYISSIDCAKLKNFLNTSQKRSSHFKDERYLGEGQSNGAFCSYGSTKGQTMRFKYNAFTSLEDWKAWVAQQYANGTPLEVAFEMANQKDTPLSADELAAFATLRSNKPNTTVFNDSGAGMKLEYVADTKTYIDNKFNELALAILNNA